MRLDVAHVFGPLVRLRDQCALMQAVKLRADTASARVDAPWILRRTVRMSVVQALPVERVETVIAARHLRGHLVWRLRRITPDVTRVEVQLKVLRAGPFTRCFLALGGRAWLERELAAMLRQLERAGCREAVRCARSPIPLYPLLPQRPVCLS